MLRIQFFLLAFCCTTALFAQQTLTPRIAVYNTNGERFVVDSARLTDSTVILKIGDLSFDINEEEFARLEPIPGATFSEPDQIYSIKLSNGKIVVGQVFDDKRGMISIRTATQDTLVVSRNDIKGINLEKRNIFQKSHVKECATTNFTSSPYALKAKEAIFSSFIYGNSLEVGFGRGFSGKIIASVLPFYLPTGFELAYRKKLVNSNFSIGMSVGQIYLGPVGEFISGETVNSSGNVVTILTPNFTYHMGDAFLKTGVTVLSGTLDFASGGGVIINSTYSAPGINKPHNRWNFTANIVPNPSTNSRNDLNINTFFLAGYQVHAPKASYTLGLGFARNDAFTILPFPYAYFSLYSSKEQQKISNAFNIQRRMRFLQRSISFENARNKKLRERASARELRQQQRRKR